MNTICLLQSEKGRTFVESGLVVLRENYGMWRRIGGRKDLTDPREIACARVYQHECVHFRQALSCSYVFDYAHDYVAACMKALQSFKDAPDEPRDRFNALHQEMRERRAKAGERVEMHERPEGVLVVPIDVEDTLTPADIIEGMAVLGSFQMSTPGASAQDFREFMGREHYDDSQPEYWNTFELVAHAVSPEAAYEVLSPLSFAALQTERPTLTFKNLLEKAKHAGSGLVERCRDVGRLFEFAEIDFEKHFLFHLDDFEERQRHPILHPCARHAVERIGAGKVLQFVANPLDLYGAIPEHQEALRPPVVAMSSDQSGKVASVPGGRARDDLDFVTLVLHFTALIGAAERLFFPTDEHYQFCLHEQCPHYESALCFQYFTPPSMERGYENCQFPISFHTNVGLAPDEAWQARGYQRKSVDELVAAFERTGEAGILALARKEKRSLIAWLGEDGYVDLEWKCDAVAQKALRALQTQKIDHLMEARMFLQAVVREVRQLASRDVT